MTVTVQYSGQARKAAEIDSEKVDPPDGCSMAELLGKLAEKHGALREMLLTADGSVQPSLMLFLNDEQVMRGEAVAFKDGDGLMIVPPISGG